MTTHAHRSADREDIYRLLAACYYSPTRAFVEEECCSQLAALLAPRAPDAAAAARESAEALLTTDHEELAVEHARLFIGPFQLIAPPYGSYYLDETRTVMGKSTPQVAAFYQANGLQLAEDFHELPDHIAVELEFMSYLAFKERESLHSGRRELVAQQQLLQREFLAHFLLPWLEPFTKAIIDDGEAPFYQSVARCTASFVAADLAALNRNVHT